MTTKKQIFGKKKNQILVQEDDTIYEVDEECTMQKNTKEEETGKRN